MLSPRSAAVMLRKSTCVESVMSHRTPPAAQSCQCVLWQPICSRSLLHAFMPVRIVASCLQTVAMPLLAPRWIARAMSVNSGLKQQQNQALARQPTAISGFEDGVSCTVKADHTSHTHLTRPASSRSDLKRRFAATLEPRLLWWVVFRGPVLAAGLVHCPPSLASCILYAVTRIVGQCRALAIQDFMAASRGLGLQRVTPELGHTSVRNGHKLSCLQTYAGICLRRRNSVARRLAGLRKRY